MTRKNSDIAVRLYENNKYGSTYGKALYHTAIFNGTADLRDPQVKYLLDFHPFSKWQMTAKDDLEMDVVNMAYERSDDQTLVSWVVRYNTRTGAKEKVTGFSTMDLMTSQLYLAVYDPELEVQRQWNLEARPCKHVEGKRSPALLATNYELGGW